MRRAGRWRRATNLAGGCEMATMSTLERTDNGDVVVGLGAWWCRLCVGARELTMVTWLWVLVRGGADSAWVPPVSHGGFWKNFLFYGRLSSSALPASSRCSHLDIWIFPSPLYLSVLVLVYPPPLPPSPPPPLLPPTHTLPKSSIVRLDGIVDDGID